VTVRDYHLPAFVDESSLVLIISYSGKTEETLSIFTEALERNCKVITISSGGPLLRYCREFNLPFIEIPTNLPPRVALPYTFLPMVIILEKLNLIMPKDNAINEMLNVLEALRNEIKPDIPLEHNIAKQIALSLEGKIPVIYGHGYHRAVALRMKTQFNENSKVPARCETFPELDHNDIVGWEGPAEITKNFAIILLRDEEEPIEIKTRIELTKEIILEKVENIVEIYGRGKSKLTKIMSLIFLGDFISIYLALLYGRDPMPVKSISRLKIEIARRTNVLDLISQKLQSFA
jgi:glucose/mannose-6-phosphate isomerase